MLTKAIEINPELRLLVPARSHDGAYYLEAVVSGALDYLEGRLSAAEIVDFVETFMSRRTSARLARGTWLRVQDRAKRARVSWNQTMCN